MDGGPLWIVTGPGNRVSRAGNGLSLNHGLRFELRFAQPWIRLRAAMDFASCSNSIQRYQIAEGLSFSARTRTALRSSARIRSAAGTNGPSKVQPLAF